MFSKLKNLFGGRPETSSAQPPSPSVKPQPSASSPTTRAMRVARLVRETEDAVTVSLETVDGGPVSFSSGQFLNLELKLPEGPVWRAYSICSAPRSGELAVTVKRIAGGRASTYINQNISVGQVLSVRGPSGAFVLPESSQPRHVVLIAGGSGITPMMSHTRHLLETEPESRVTLLYGNRAERDIIFHAALATMREQHPGRLKLRHVLAEPSDKLDCGRGMLDSDTVLRELRQLELRADDADLCLICGPSPMMSGARTALLALGIANERILEERFTAAGPTGKQLAESSEQIVQVRVKGKLVSFPVAPGETILEGSIRAELVLDFSCATGACGTCMMRMAEGDVEMEEPNVLTDDERAAGLILPCVSRPNRACTLEPHP